MRLTRLRYLNISENAFEVLPEAVLGMAGLMEPRVTDNRLTDLPDSIVRLACLPASLATLPRLEKLDLRWVTTLSAPPWFAELEARGCAIYR